MRKSNNEPKRAQNGANASTQDSAKGRKQAQMSAKDFAPPRKKHPTRLGTTRSANSQEEDIATLKARPRHVEIAVSHDKTHKIRNVD